MSIKFGVVAEDNSDIQVITELIAKYLPRNSFCVKHFVGKGCGKLKNKCSAWVKNLSTQGCSHIFIFHDLDRNKEDELRAELRKKLEDCNFDNHLIVIPKEELEAWLLSDTAAIKKTFNITQDIKPLGDVETIPSPKEFLQKLVKKLSKKTYINTIHNSKIATNIELNKLTACDSYLGFDKYITENCAQ